MHALRNAFFATIIVASAVVGSPALAGTATGSIAVTATVVSSCNVTGSTLNFGSAINPTTQSVPVDASTSVTVVCTATTPYAVSLNAGLNAGGASNFSARSLKSGTNSLGYQLYSDSTRATVWGDGTSSSSTLPGVGTGSNQTLTVYGRLPSVTGAVPGSYTDTVTVTVTY